MIYCMSEVLKVQFACSQRFPDGLPVPLCSCFLTAKVYKITETTKK